MGYFDSFDSEQGSKSIGGTLNLTDFEQSFLNKINDSEILSTKWKAEEAGVVFSKKNKAADIYEYGTEDSIKVCPEPINFIKEFSDVSDNKEKAHRRFIEKIESFGTIQLTHVPTLETSGEETKRMWINKTLTGINLRPGNLNDDRDNFTAVKMCDDNVHGLIAGRTGSGKSVYINALILSLITEYPPWELDLYLADFKKVELSRYMNDSDEVNQHTPFTPHIKACAATSEIRYVLSLIKHLVDCMNARNEFFTRLGVTKIQEFRETYNIVLPRVLLIVDEFQQLFSEATNREAEEIQTMLNSITKLGRATGFHLIFASQEMSGTLHGNTLANFKIRMTLPCNKQISLDILGNGEAEQLERGYVLVNTESGDALANQKYHVPFIETDKKDSDSSEKKTPFYDYLDRIKLESKKFQMNYKTETQKFYREELQEKEIEYLADLDRIKEGKNKAIAGNGDIYDGIVLGRTVLYSEKKNDKVSFYIERGRNRGIMIASPNADDVARIRKLITENLIRSDGDITHVALELNGLVYGRYELDKQINRSEKQVCYQLSEQEGLAYIRTIYNLRKQSSIYLKDRRNRESIQKLAELEEELARYCSDEKAVIEYEQYIAEFRRLENQVRELQIQMKELEKLSKDRLMNPVIEFLEKCDASIIMIRNTNEKVGYFHLQQYREIVEQYRKNWDTQKVSDEAAAKLEVEIQKYQDKKDKDSMIILLRLKILKRAILYYTDRYHNIEPEKTSLTPELDRNYEKILYKIEKFRDDLKNKKQVSDQREQLVDKLDEATGRLERLMSMKNPLKTVMDNISVLVQSYVQFCYENTYAVMGIKKGGLPVPKIEIVLENGQRICRVEEEAGQEALDGPEKMKQDELKRLIDILSSYGRGSHKNKLGAANYGKCVFWLNGLDEIEKVPNYLPEIIRDAINYNILAIVTITSELKDSTIRKAFDYAFITGNIEKFYNMFDIKYTKQPLDSIVINFGIRSKGLSIPFKIYQSDLDDSPSLQIIEDLLEDAM